MTELHTLNQTGHRRILCTEPEVPSSKKPQTNEVSGFFSSLPFSSPHWGVAEVSGFFSSLPFSSPHWGIETGEAKAGAAKLSPARRHRVRAMVRMAPRVLAR